MLFVLLFTAGLIVLLAGLSSLILKGPRLANSMLAVLGFVALGAGAGGAVIKPRLPNLTFAESASPAPIEKASQAAAEPPVPIAPPPESAPVAAPVPPAPTAPQPDAPMPPPVTADGGSGQSKDSAQLQPIAPAPPISVTTKTISGDLPDQTVNAAPPPASPSPPPTADMPAPAAITAPPPAPALAPPPAAPTPSQADRLAALADRQPKDETSFLKVLSTARAAFDKANDAQRNALQSKRASAICAAVNKPEIQSWIGQLGDVDRDPGGRSIVSVILSDGTTLKTWNNAMSDLDDKTLILAGTPLAAALGKLRHGDAIRFSGSFFPDDADCYRTTRLSLDQSMSEPSFLFRFKGLEKLADGT